MNTRNKTALIVTGLALALFAGSSQAHRSHQGAEMQGVNMQGNSIEIKLEHRSIQGRKANGVDMQGSFTRDITVEYRSRRGRDSQGRDSKSGTAFDFGAMKVKDVQR